MNSHEAKLFIAAAITAAVTLAAVVGCGTQTQDSSENQAEPEAQGFSFRLATAEDLQEAIKRQRGKVVLVDFWATWCAPCVEQFPHTVELEREHRDRGLAVIGVSMDAPSAEAQVREFLQRHDAQFANFLSGYRSPVEATQAFGLPGPVPCYRVYDRSGDLRHEFAVNPRAKQQFTAEDVAAVVEKML